jgi:hypothetical protein
VAASGAPLTSVNRFEAAPRLPHPCGNCGRNNHPASGCPAAGRPCNKCQKVGHFGVVCRSSRGRGREELRGRGRGRGGATAQPHYTRATHHLEVAELDAEAGDAYTTHQHSNEAEANSLDFFALHQTSHARPLLAFAHLRNRPDLVKPIERTPVGIQVGDATGTIGFVADTGANVTAIAPDDLRHLGIPDSALYPPPSHMRPPSLADGTPGSLRVLGITPARLTHRGRSHTEDVYVYHNLGKPLLSREACLALHIFDQAEGEQSNTVQTRPPSASVNKHATDSYLHFVHLRRAQSGATPLTWPTSVDLPPLPEDPVGDSARRRQWERLKAEHPRPLDGVCRVMKGGQVCIKLRPGELLRSVYSCRDIPIPLRTAFETELKEQIAAGIIERAHDCNDPAALISPTVITRKKNNTVRITVDLTNLNRVSYRPPFLSPSPWQVVSQINPEAKFFTVVDGLKGFHQLELEP